MKIGLLTVHCSTNPGASLQAYALSKTLLDVGYDVEIIDYRPSYFTSIADPAKHIERKNIKQLVSQVLFGYRAKRDYKDYLAFEDQYMAPKTKRYDYLEALEEDIPLYDAYICGSDQIWNPQHTHYDTAMELSFAKHQSLPCYSYAASIGQDILMDRDVVFLREQLKGFQSISVREESAKRFLEKELHMEGIYRHIDPSFLLKEDEWRRVSSKKHKEIQGKYILFYPLADNAISESLLKAVKKDFALPIVALSRKVKRISGVDIQYRVFSPNDFVDLIDNAEIVITNSFHGCCFSLMFKKKLLCYQNVERNTRMQCLFELFGIEKAQITCIDDYSQSDKCSLFSRIKINEDILEKERAKALAYLRGIGCDGNER